MLVTRVWQKWRFSAPQTVLWLIKVWFSASPFVVKIANFAKPETVRCNATSDNTLFKTLGFENRKNNFNLSHLTNENLVALTYQERGIYY